MIICTYNYKLTLSLDMCKYMNELNSSVRYRYYYIGLHKATYAFYFLLPSNLLLFDPINFKSNFKDNSLIRLFLLIWLFIGVQCLVWNTAKNGYFLWLCKNCMWNELLWRRNVCNGCVLSIDTSVWRTHSHWHNCQMKPNPSSSHSSPIMLNKPPIVSHNVK